MAREVGAGNGTESEHAAPRFGGVRRLIGGIGSRVVLLTVLLTTVSCDQVSKHLASTMLAGEPRQSFLGDTVRLEYAENPGAFLSLGAELPEWERTAIFSVGTAILIVVGGVMLWRRRWSQLALLGLCLALAGGISNWIDRVAHGRVVDFLNVGVGPLRTGIFNVADMAIMLGVGLILLQSTVLDNRRAPRVGGPST